MVASQPIYNRYERRMVDTIWGTTNKPVSTKKLAERIESADALVGTLYVGYPILGTPAGDISIRCGFIKPTARRSYL
jgi:hypothetical protein